VSQGDRIGGVEYDAPPIRARPAVN
jgi:hypothetical protein